jgi:hypothetical protein
VFLAAAISSAEANTFLGLRCGFHQSEETLFAVGGEVRSPISKRTPLFLNLSLDYLPDPEITFFLPSVSVIYSLKMEEAPIEPFFGGGLGAAYLTADGESATFIGGTVSGGVDFSVPNPNWMPFGMLRAFYFRGSEGEFRRGVTLLGGVRFNVSRPKG